MKIISEKIKEIFKNKGSFYQQINVDFKSGSKKLKTVENKINWLNEFLKPLNLKVSLSEINSPDRET